MKPDELLKLIKKRRSIRRWIDKPVEEEKVKKILTAGVYAPTACNYQATRFYVVKDKKLIKKICQNCAKWFWNNHPTVVILVLFDVSKHHPLKFDLAKPHPLSRFIWQDTSAAMMNMMLMAEALGLKTCWVSIIPQAEKNIRALVKIPSSYIMTCMLFLGYSKRKVDINTAKHWNRPIKRNEQEFIVK